MADLAHKLVITLTWENKKAFKMVADNATAKVTIIECQEDGNLSILWPNIQSLAELYFKAEIESIGAEMKKP